MVPRVGVEPAVFGFVDRGFYPLSYLGKSLGWAIEISYPTHMPTVWMV